MGIMQTVKDLSIKQQELLLAYLQKPNHSLAAFAMGLLIGLFMGWF